MTENEAIPEAAAPTWPPAAAPASEAGGGTSQAEQDAAWAAAQTSGWETRRAAVEAEYGKWLATQTIEINGVTAFLKGHAVPISHVDRYGLDRREGGDGQALVVERDSDDGRQLLASVAAAARGE